MNRGPAIWTTIVALVLINVGAAATIVVLTGNANSMPLWLGLTLTAIGVAVLVAAVRLWRAYLRLAHEVTHGGSARSRARSPGEKGRSLSTPKKNSGAHG